MRCARRSRASGTHFRQRQANCCRWAGGGLTPDQQPIRSKAVEAPPKRITVSSRACSLRRSRNECQVRRGSPSWKNAPTILEEKVRALHLGGCPGERRPSIRRGRTTQPCRQDYPQLRTHPDKRSRSARVPGSNSDCWCACVLCLRSYLRSEGSTIATACADQLARLKR